MGLLSIFQRKKQTAAKPAKSRAKSPARQAPAAPSVDTAEAVREARTRARRRLMGATVLLLVGVIGFPLLFETQPRPIPVDLPIEIPARNGATVVDAPVTAPPHAKGPSSAALALAAALQAASSAHAGTAAQAIASEAHATGSAPVSAAADAGGRPSGASTLASALHAGDAGASAASASPPAANVKPRPAVPSAPKPAVVAAASKPAPIPHAQPVLPPPAASQAGNGSSGETAAALLAGKPVPRTPEPAAEGGRFVVQIGAFADDAKMHEARGKVEKLGLKTYTQAVDTPSGKRVRVRVGPYQSKAEADKVAARIKADGLPAAVLVL